MLLSWLHAGVRGGVLQWQGGGLQGGDAAFLGAVAVMPVTGDSRPCQGCAGGGAGDRASAWGAPPPPSQHGGLCATHPGDTVTIETTALHRVGKTVRCDSSPTCLAQSERRWRGGGTGQCRWPPLPRCTPKPAQGNPRPLSMGLGAAHPRCLPAGHPGFGQGSVSQRPPQCHQGPPEVCHGRGSPAPVPRSLAPAALHGQALPSGPAGRARGSCRQVGGSRSLPRQLYGPKLQGLYRFVKCSRFCLFSSKRFPNIEVSSKCFANI